jgi:hypothetical protein
LTDTRFAEPRFLPLARRRGGAIDVLVSGVP